MVDCFPERPPEDPGDERPRALLPRVAPIVGEQPGAVGLNLQSWAILAMISGASPWREDAASSNFLRACTKQPTSMIPSRRKSSS
jgi:hypothetical protein